MKKSLEPGNTGGDPRFARTNVVQYPTVCQKLTRIAAYSRIRYSVKLVSVSKPSRLRSRAIEVVNNAKKENGQLVGYNLTANGLVWPIPQAELDKNTKLVQNPGY